MRLLSLGDLKLGLQDLLGRNAESLALLACGRTYKPLLEKKLEEFNLLPASFLENKPLADRLSEVDADHDGFGLSVWHTIEAHIRNPLVSTQVKDAALRIRSAFIPRLAALNESYAVEANAALDRAKHLPALEDDLKSIPVAGGTLYDWVKGYLDKGAEIFALLSSSADAQRGSTMQLAATLRQETISLFERLRAAIQDELTANPDLPRDLEDVLFGDIDQAHSTRAETRAPISMPIPAGAMLDDD